MNKLNRHSLVLASAFIAGVTLFRVSPTRAAPTLVRKPASEILFISPTPNQKLDVYSVRSDGSGLRKLARQPLGCIGASWSPDKKSVVLAIATNTNTVQKRVIWRYNLAIMNARTGWVRDIRISGHPNLKTFAPFFAPSGKAILFTGSTHPRFSGLYSIKLDGSNLKQLAIDGNASVGSFSPDGKRIVYSKFHNGRASIFVMDHDGQNVRQLTHNGFNNQTPRWSPNGKRIAFASNRSGTFQIYSMNADGRGQKQLTKNGYENSTPTFSPDGRRIAFARQIKNIIQIYVMNSDGTQQKRVGGIKNAYYPDWR